jgi:hypothetical protein
MDINAEISDMKVALASLEAKAKALETPKQWEPRGGDWSIQSNGLVKHTHGNRGLLHKEFGEMRLTKEAAHKARDAMRTHNRLLAYVDEFGGDWEADWSDRWQRKFTVLRCHETKQWAKESWGMQETLGTVYMSLDCAEGLVFKLEVGEVLL